MRGVNQNGEDPELPDVVRAAWGVRAAPAKGPKRALSLPRIVDAAIGIARERGLGAVSMSAVAGELGASTMALYRYVAAKEELLVLMADAGYGPPPTDQPVESDWRAGLSRWAWTERARLRANPWLLHVPISGLQMLMPNQTRWVEWGLTCLRDTPLPLARRMSTILLVSSYVRAESLTGEQFRQNANRLGQSDQEVMTSVGNAFRSITDAEEFPQLRAAVDSGMFEADDGPDDEFIFGLERILDGIDALIKG